MALFRRFFYRKPPDHLLEISDKVYVFDCCFSTHAMENDAYKIYMADIVAQLQDYYPDASFVVFDFREDHNESQIADVLSQYTMKVMEYPCHYEGCLVLPLEMIIHFLQSCESWLSVGAQQNVLLMHCQRGGWPVLAFMLAGLLLFRKQYSGEQKTLEMVYKQAPKELLRLFSSLDPQPSQLRYLQYISRKNLASDWPPSDIPLSLDCIILRVLPLFNGKGCRPIIRIYGQDSSSTITNRSKLLFSSLKTNKQARHHRREKCELVKIDIHHRVQGDVVLECIHLDDDHVREEMMFRLMFHTAFVRGYVLMLSRDDIDVRWDTREQMPKNFQAEVLFLDADPLPSIITTEAGPEDGSETESASSDEFFEVEERFSSVVDGEDAKAESGPHLIKDSKGDAKSHDKVFREETEPQAFQDSVPDDGDKKCDDNKKCNVEVDSNLQSVKDTDLGHRDGDLKPTVMAANEHDKTDTKEVKLDLSQEMTDKQDGPRQKLGKEDSQQKLSGNISWGTSTNSKAIADTGDKQKAIVQLSLAPTPLPSPPLRNLEAKSPEVPAEDESSASLVSPPKPALYPSAASQVPPSPPPSGGPPSPPPITYETPPPPPLVHGSTSFSPPLAHGPPPPLPPPSGSPTSHPPPLMVPSPPRPSNNEAPSPPPLPSGSLSSPYPSLPSDHLAPPSPPIHEALPPPPSPLVHEAHSLSPLLAHGPTPPSPPPSGGLLSPAPSLRDPSPPPPSNHGASSPPLPSDSLPSPSPPLPSNRLPPHSEPPRPPPPPEPPGPPLPPRLPSIGPPPPPAGGHAVSPHLFLGPLAPPGVVPPLPLPVGLTPQPPSPPRPPGVRPPPSPPPPPPAAATGGGHAPGPPPPPGIGPPPPPPPPGGHAPGPPPPPGIGPPPPPPPPGGHAPGPPPPPGIGPPPPPPPPGGHAPGPPPPPGIGPPPPPPPPPGGHAPGPPPPPGIGPPPPPPPPPGGHAPGPPPPPGIGPPPPPPPPPGGHAPGPPPSPGIGPPPPPGGHAPGPPPPPGPPGIGPPPPPPPGGHAPGPPGIGPPPPRGRGLSRPGGAATKRSNLKPLHWSKVSKALQGSLWEEFQRFGELQSASEFDVSELEKLFPAIVPNKGGSKGGKEKSAGSKTDKVNLIDLRRANNTLIMLTKIKMPYSDMVAAALAMDESALDSDQVENIIKFCPTKEEMELLKNYTGDKENLGPCEQYYLELMKVPRIESKLSAFLFKIQFNTQLSEFKKSLTIVYSACIEVRSSVKLKEIMKRILYLGNILNQGTARGSAVGFKLESLLKLTDTRAFNSRMTLMHYLCKVLEAKSSTLLDFHKDLVNLEAATKIQVKCLAEEMQAIIQGLEKVKQELAASANEGPVSEVFNKTLKEFIGFAEAEVVTVTNSYAVVGRHADALALYFGEDPARCTFEQVTQILYKFMTLFQKAHEENRKVAELEKKKAEKEIEMAKRKGTNITKKGEK